MDSDEEGEGLPHVSETEGFAYVVGASEEEEAPAAADDRRVRPSRGEILDLVWSKGVDRRQGGSVLEIAVAQGPHVALNRMVGRIHSKKESA